MSKSNELGFLDQVFEPFFSPSIFDRSVFHGLGVNQLPTNIMKTDVRELDDKFIAEIDIPGIDKKDISIELSDGYLTISAKKESSKEEKKEGSYIRQERYFGAQSRRFFVGDQVTKEDIKAKFDNGVLTIEVPKLEPPKPETEKIDIN